jgi:hypothetical protein
MNPAVITCSSDISTPSIRESAVRKKAATGWRRWVLKYPGRAAKPRKGIHRRPKWLRMITPSAVQGRALALATNAG